MIYLVFNLFCDSNRVIQILIHFGSPYALPKRQNVNITTSTRINKYVDPPMVEGYYTYIYISVPPITAIQFN